MYRPGIFSAARSGDALPLAPSAAAPRVAADWNAFGRRGAGGNETDNQAAFGRRGAGGNETDNQAAFGRRGGGGSDHHEAFGRRQPRESREERPRAPVYEYVPSNSLTAHLNHALKGVEPKEEEWQTRLRSLQKKREPHAIIPVATRPKPVDLSSVEAFPTLGAAPTPKSSWAPKTQSFASLMKKHVEDETEAARVESERKATEERARAEREREARRYNIMPSRLFVRSAGDYQCDGDDDHDDTYNPENDLDYQYNAVRREEPEMQAEAAEEEEASVEDDNGTDGW